MALHIYILPLPMVHKLGGFSFGVLFLNFRDYWGFYISGKIPREIGQLYKGTHEGPGMIESPGVAGGILGTSSPSYPSAPVCMGLQRDLCLSCILRSHSTRYITSKWRARASDKPQPKSCSPHDPDHRGLFLSKSFMKSSHGSALISMFNI